MGPIHGTIDLFTLFPPRINPMNPIIRQIQIEKESSLPQRTHISTTSDDVELGPNHSINHYVQLCQAYARHMKMLCCLSYTQNPSIDNFKAPTTLISSQKISNKSTTNRISIHIIQNQASKIYNISPTIQKKIHRLLLDPEHLIY